MVQDYILSGVSDFSLRDTLDCGQCFRWNETAENTFFGAARGKALEITQDGDRLIFKNTSKEDYLNIWQSYFDLETDYGEIKSRLSADPTLKKAAQFAPGIRILHQEPWEALCSFIISQNNNIKRIKGIVERLCESFGEPIADGVYDFPSYDVLARLSEADLAPLRCGFRARYIIDAARKVSSGEVDLERLKTCNIDEARQELIKITGVGAKVAECALLYGCGRIEGFPMDVWMKRAMTALFPNGLPECALPYAGIAQQYIFHYVRSCPEVLSEGE